MGYKTISLSDAVYRKLRAERRKDESFNDAISRLLAMRQPSLRDYFGAWKPMSRREYLRVRERIDKVRHGTP
jgi:predicted CopG family antitoxin